MQSQQQSPAEWNNVIYAYVKLYSMSLTKTQDTFMLLFWFSLGRQYYKETVYQQDH